MDPGSYDSVRAIVLGIALLAILGLEHRAPNAPMTRPWRTNLGLWLADTALMRLVCGACGLVVAAWAEARGIGLFHALALPAALAIALSIVALDGVSWLWHRANHRLPWLWRWHGIHHADQAFQVTTALRFHPGELLQALPVRLAAIVAFGISPAGLIVFEICFGVMNLFVHGNFDLARRWDARLGRVFVTPSMHRLHHARDHACANSNFGTVFSLFDRIAGTWRPGDPGAAVETGLPDVHVSGPMTLREALAQPFASSAKLGRD